jgi:hypothetical protein
VYCVWSSEEEEEFKNTILLVFVNWVFPAEPLKLCVCSEWIEIRV